MTLTRLELELICSILVPVSAYLILSVRVDAGKVPWSKLLTKADFFGGRKVLLRDLFWLLVWVLSSVACGLIVAIAIKGLGEPLVQTVYDWITTNTGFSAPRGANAGLASLVAFALVFYLFVVRKVHSLVVKDAEHIPLSVLRGATDSDISNGLVAASLKQGETRFRLFLKFLFYLVPILLKPGYHHFYSRTGLILRGCVNLLLEEFGRQLPVSFIEHDTAVRADPRMIYLTEMMPEHGDGLQCACIVYMGMVRIHGFSVTRQIMKSHAQVLGWDLDGDQYSGEERRHVGRAKPVLHLPCYLHMPDGQSVGVRIRDISVDGSCAFVELSNIDPKIWREENKFRLTVQGQNVSVSLRHTRVYAGCECAVVGIEKGKHRQRMCGLIGLA